jgi:hypothetical protein
MRAGVRKLAVAVSAVLMICFFGVAVFASALVWDEVAFVRGRLRSAPKLTKRLRLAVFASEGPWAFLRPELLPPLRCFRRNVICCRGAMVSELVARQIVKPSRAIRWHTETKLVSFTISRIFTTDELIAVYLDTLTFDSNRGAPVEGAVRGASAYFGKSAEDLTLSEAIALLTIARQPKHFSPYEHPDRVLTRRNSILGSLRDRGLISQDLLLQSLHEPLRLAPRG